MAPGALERLGHLSPSATPTCLFDKREDITTYPTPDNTHLRLPYTPIRLSKDDPRFTATCPCNNISLTNARSWTVLYFSRQWKLPLLFDRGKLITSICYIKVVHEKLMILSETDRHLIPASPNSYSFHNITLTERGDGHERVYGRILIPASFRKASEALSKPSQLWHPRLIVAEHFLASCYTYVDRSPVLSVPDEPDFSRPSCLVRDHILVLLRAV